MTATQPVTADQLYQMGSNAPCELWEGVLKEVMPSSPKLCEIGVLLTKRIGQFVLEQSLGHMTGTDGGYILEQNPQTVVSPDFGFVRRERLPRGFPAWGFCPMSPDLAVEVISPTDRKADIAEKQELYRRAGVPLVWWADPERRTVTVHWPDQAREILDESGILDGGEVLPGFTLEVRTIFGD